MRSAAMSSSDCAHEVSTLHLELGSRVMYWMTAEENALGFTFSDDGRTWLAERARAFEASGAGGVTS